MMDVKIETMILDAVEAAIGSQSGVIVVRDAEERLVATKYLAELARRAHTPGIDEKTQIVVVPAARTVHWRPSLPV